jgi:D-sedoheptulose 7-phosphate isomerase
VINKYLNDVNAVVLDLEISKVDKIIQIIREVRERKSRIYTFGNGGSGSTASHFAGDLAKACGCRTMCLDDSITSLTAWANDSDYRVVFERQLDNNLSKGDLVIAISGSGNSPNIIRGLQLAKSKGIFTIGLTAFDGGLLKSVADLYVIVPTKNMEIAEDLHSMICHIIKTALVEK